MGFVTAKVHETRDSSVVDLCNLRMPGFKLVPCQELFTALAFMIMHLIWI